MIYEIRFNKFRRQFARKTNNIVHLIICVARNCTWIRLMVASLNWKLLKGRQRERERKGITNNILYLFGEYATKEQLFNEMKRKRVHECYKRQWFGLACVDFISH